MAKTHRFKVSCTTKDGRVHKFYCRAIDEKAAIEQARKDVITQWFAERNGELSYTAYRYADK